MKQHLLICDACNKTVPVEGIKGWWGHKKCNNQIIFAPYVKATRKDFETGHACSEECLALLLKNYASTADRKIKAAIPSMSFYSMLMGERINGDDGGISDSVGYYGKPAAPKEEDDDES